MALYNVRMAQLQLTHTVISYPMIFDSSLFNTSGGNTIDLTWDNLHTDEIMSHISYAVGAAPSIFPAPTTSWSQFLTALYLALNTTPSSDSELFAGMYNTNFSSTAGSVDNQRRSPYIEMHAQQNMLYYYIPILSSNAVNSNGKLLINSTTAGILTTIQVLITNADGANGTDGKWRISITGQNYHGTVTAYRFNQSETVDPPPLYTDPYNRIVGVSTTGGGNGSGDFTGQTIGEPSLPQISALNSGFISAYAPSVANLNQLAAYMWTSDFADNLKKVFGDNPMNTILGLSCVPVQPPLGGGSTVILGNIDTGISMPTIGAQYTKVNCGSIAIEPKYGAFLDYEPYTSIDLFLPYIGMVQLSTNDVMGKSLGVVYTVDVLSGACVANVSCGGSIMYTFEGACATQFPVTNNDYSNVFKAAVDAASSIVGAVGGAVASGMTGNVAGAVTSIVDGAAGAATAAMNAHPTVNRSGSLSGSAGLMGIQHPFIVWTTPNMVASNGQNNFIGYPNFITTTLSGCAGYTEVENINLGIAGATSEEVAEIKTLLKNGVIF